MNFFDSFAQKHPKAAQWIREGGLFIIFSYVVTFIKYLLLTFLPGFYQGIVGDVEWVWPGIRTQMFGVPFTLALIGNSLADGGLAFTLANYTSIILGECINFPLQRNVTFRSHGPVLPQIGFHALGTIGVMLVMNLFTCIWNPVTAAFGIPDAVRNIVTTIATGGVAMVIIFAIDKTIFTSLRLTFLMHFDWYIDCLHYAHHSSRLTFQKSAPRCERFFMHFSPGARLHLWSRRSPGMADWVQERKTEICSLRFFEPEGFWVQKARFTNQIQRIFTNSIVFRYSRGFFKNCSLWQSLLWAQRRILKK